jgi:hypothetical protein
MYGTGTRSYHRSAEHRENKRQQKLATKRFLEKKAAGELKAETAPLLCRCHSFRFPHETSAHRRLKSDYDWRPFEQREAEQENWEEWAKPL